MDGTAIDRGQTGEDIFAFDVSDETLEATAAKPAEKAVAFTAAFCSGLDTCPA